MRLNEVTKAGPSAFRGGSYEKRKSYPEISVSMHAQRERQCGEVVKAGKRGLTSNQPCWCRDLGLAAPRAVKVYVSVV